MAQRMCKLLLTASCAASLSNTPQRGELRSKASFSDSPRRVCWRRRSSGRRSQQLVWCRPRRQARGENYATLLGSNDCGNTIDAINLSLHSSDGFDIASMSSLSLSLSLAVMIKIKPSSRCLALDSLCLIGPRKGESSTACLGGRQKSEMA